jgi:uncharacterized protein YqeY
MLLRAQGAIAMDQERVLREVKSELKDAMRKRDQLRLDALRQIETEVAKAKSAPGFQGKVDDALYLEVIAAYVKKMDKARGEFEVAGERGKEMIEKLSFEVDYLSRWLPKRLDEAQTRALLQKIIAELGVSGSGGVGRVMGHVMKHHKEEVDGGLVNRLARELLG